MQYGDDAGQTPITEQQCAQMIQRALTEKVAPVCTAGFASLSRGQDFLTDKFQALEGTFFPTLRSCDHPLFDLAYADDAVIMARTAETRERVLHFTQQIASQ